MRRRGNCAANWLRLVAALLAPMLVGCPEDEDSESEVPENVGNTNDNSNDEVDPDDLDSDDVPDADDNCPNTFNDDQDDIDGDGIGDGCDNCEDTPNPAQADRDGDRAGDACDACPDDPLKAVARGPCGCGTREFDLSGDGLPDCTGDPSFAERIIDDVIVGGAQVELTDLDNDGDLDVVAAVTGTRAVYGYVNQDGGSSWFRFAVAGPAGFAASAIALGDFDGDGDLDVAALEQSDPSVGPISPGEAVWFRRPVNSLLPWDPFEVSGQTLWGARGLATGDLTGDGRADIVVSTVPSAGAPDVANLLGLHWFVNQQGGSSWSDRRTINPNAGDVQTVLTADIDGDGDLDAVAAESSRISSSWYENARLIGQVQENPPFIEHFLGRVSDPFDIVAVAGLGRGEGLVILATDVDSRAGLGLAYYSPRGDVTASWLDFRIASDFPSGTESRVCPVDFNDDGRNDVAATSIAREDLRVYMDARNERDFITWQWVGITGGGYDGLKDVACGDIDRDGRFDLVTITSGHPGGDRVSWWPNPAVEQPSPAEIPVVLDRFDLELEVGAGGGVRVNPPDEICRGACTFSFDDGTEVELTASPDGGFNFTDWSGDCGPGGAMWMVTLDREVMCGATFAPAGGGGGGGGGGPPPAPFCGDGVVNNEEACDTAGPSATCDANCTAVACGDGTINEPAGEQCDDSNMADEDGCSSTCQTEFGPSTCGNEITEPPEQCDDGNSEPGDDCDELCRIEECGNGFTQTDEQCDAGGATAGCDADCTFVVCGDGTINEAAGEQCDDGNVLNDDGCSSTCMIEGGGGQFTLTLQINADGRGFVSSDPPGIGCEADCAALFDADSVVLLTVVAFTPAAFGGWNGCDPDGDFGVKGCQVTMNQDRIVGVVFLVP
ncbi:MAG: DUF4215 domain-containing protein [Phycisphaerales bacterium]|nr:DUF4215 domain-containing protein [Phycisphaerales bacterium]